MRAGYPVIFFHRKETMQPFSIEIQSQWSEWLETLNKKKDTTIKFRKWVSTFQKYHNETSKHSALLLKIEFTTVTEYLRDLEVISGCLKDLNQKSITYLAAAVSDFFLPEGQIPEHKIPSSKDGLNLKLQPVPKVLGQIKSKWNPGTVLIAFKLETDGKVLEQKCSEYMGQYGLDMIVGNELKSRRNNSVVFHKGDKSEDLKLLDPQYLEHMSELIVTHVLTKLNLPSAAMKEEEEDRRKFETKTDDAEKLEIYVSNIEAKVTESQIAKEFDEFGETTKVKLMRAG